MSNSLENLEQQLGSKRDSTSPPLERWHPPLSGDIDIHIRADGSWIHEGDPIKRNSLMRMFASILRREDDGDYYLVTPVEKWRLRVELHPLIVTDVALRGGELILTLNTGREFSAGEEYPLFLEPRRDNVAAVKLWHGLTALFSRNAWYRFVELADEDGVIHTAAYHFSLV